MPADLFDSQKGFPGPAKEKAHRMLAWGVLGSASDGYRFSLLTLLFSGVCEMIKPQNSTKLRLIL
jgi:hypothetical protein